MNSTPKFRWRWIALVLVALAVMLVVSALFIFSDIEAHLMESQSAPAELEAIRGRMNATWWWLFGAQLAVIVPLAAVIFWQYRVQRREFHALHETSRRLRENEELFRLITDNISDFIEVLNRDGTRIYNSASYAAVLGDTGALKSTDSFADLHPEDRKRLSRLFRQTVESGVGSSAHYRLIGQGGKTWEFESRASVTRGPDGRVDKVLIVSRDITERHVVTSRLERQNHALASLTHSDDYIGPDPVRTLRMFTETAASTLGVARAGVWFFTGNLTAIRCADLFDAEKREHTDGIELTAAAYPGYFGALVEGRTIAAHAARLDPRTAEFTRSYLVPLGITSMLDAPIRRGRQLVGVICLEHTGEQREWTPDEEAFAGSLADLLSISLEVRDHRITEAALRNARDTLEEKVIERTRELAAANERLTELDRLKSQFLAMLSHELRTPLNSILGFTGILRQQLPGPLNDEQLKQLGMIHNAARHLLGLINDLLDLSRIESGRMDIHCEQFDFSAVIAEVIAVMQPLAAPKGLQLVTNMKAGRLDLCSDRKKLFQVILNLVSNAVKFTDSGYVEISASTGGGCLVVAVRDTGIGIRQEQIANLFEAFLQLDGSARRVYEGTGLGLHLCRKLLALLGGSIRAESVFGKGSTFSFTVPLLPPASP